MFAVRQNNYIYTMKQHFQQLFKYDKYANDTILAAILAAGEPEFAVQLMAHLLRAQQVWLNRCKEIPPVAGALWPDWKADIFENLIEENYKGWVDFLDQAEPQDFEQIISYKTFSGDVFENTLANILSHVINHGTHHRAQIGQNLKLSGLEKLPNTDYIAFLRYSG
jgi:uncharacterized damage-inducible protein DinB